MKEDLAAFGRDELLELIEIYCKNWLAMDGLWFQSVEKSYGMDAAMDHDVRVWEVFTKIEAKRIKTFLNLPERAGLEGLDRALKLRLYANINRDETVWEDGALIYRTLECRVQSARIRKSMPLHPCMQVGEVEYGEFAKAIDDRLRCQRISCYPEITDDRYCCVWKFTLE